MSRVTAYVKTKVRRRVLARVGANGIDLSTLDRVPDSLAWPLQRHGVDPVARIGEVREQEPVHKLTSFLGMNVWMVTGDAEAREVLADTTSYSNDIRPFVGKRGSTTDGDIGGLGFTDPPHHTALRKLLTPEFTMRRLDRLRPRISAIVERQLDVMEAGGPVPDLVQTFAFPVPFLVICELLGLPDEDRETFRQLGSARFDVTHGGQGTFGAVSESRTFLMEATRKQRTNPGDGLIGQIIREHGDEINDFDLGGLADGAFTGGLETSASMLALGTAVLLQHRELWKSLAEDPDSVEPIVEELLRHLAVVQVAFPRIAQEDVRVGRHLVKKGSIMLVHLPAASRDPRTTLGEAFCPAKESSNHLAFGHGLHRCVGAELGRMELRTAFPALARRFPDMQLAVDPGDLEYHAKSIVYGIEALPVRLHGIVDR